jgi:hypothetical protein
MLTHYIGLCFVLIFSLCSSKMMRCSKSWLPICYFALIATFPFGCINADEIVESCFSNDIGDNDIRFTCVDLCGANTLFVLFTIIAFDGFGVDEYCYLRCADGILLDITAGCPDAFTNRDAAAICQPCSGIPAGPSTPDPPSGTSPNPPSPDQPAPSPPSQCPSECYGKGGKGMGKKGNGGKGKGGKGKGGKGKGGEVKGYSVDTFNTLISPVPAPAKVGGYNLGVFNSLISPVSTPNTIVSSPNTEP